MNKEGMQLKEQHFKEIITRNDDRIRRICSYYSPNAEDRKDMYQEVLINIWKSLDNFRGEASVSTWIYRIAVNTSLTWSGKEVRRLSLNVSNDISVLHNLISEDETDFNHHRAEALEKSLNQFSVIDKLLITLMLEKLSMREIADVIGITEPNVRVKIHRIKDTLRNQLKNLTNE